MFHVDGWRSLCVCMFGFLGGKREIKNWCLFIMSITTATKKAFEYVSTPSDYIPALLCKLMSAIAKWDDASFLIPYFKLDVG